ncbi:MAG: tRNA dihydrouridine synthase DusB [Segniliparus sp.]|uniref:tRNA dihydrouridine synthase DusB n=1 Tax=Segniliparus sp. TaxID=2804064 RepID=UPI003F3FF199
MTAVLNPPSGARPAQAGEAPGAALRIGPFSLSSPVVLAPMAGVTNLAFRTVCRELEAELTGQARGLYVNEMVMARSLTSRNPKAMRMIEFGPEERPRSMQLYTVDPEAVGEAVRMIVAEDLADHVDLNFGCPVPKVTRNGGGSALPYKRRLFARIVEAAVQGAAGAVPVTVKFRIGIDDEHHTYLDAGRIARDSGAVAVALHARTAAQLYSGTADWSAIARLKEHVTDIPVLGNGDIFAAEDAARMMAETGCDGVVVGRGCLGRPWLFAELAAALSGGAIPAPAPPNLGEVARIVLRHAHLLVEHAGNHGIAEMRKHFAWYLRGFSVGSQLRGKFSTVSSLAEIEDLLGQLPPDEPFPEEAEGPRGRKGNPQKKVALPQGWLDDPEDCPVELVDIEHSGG